MRCVACGSEAVTERSERTARGYRRFRCRACGKQSNERSGTVLNRTQYPSDVVALVVLWRVRYKLALRDLPEMFLVRGVVFSHETVRGWEAKLAPALRPRRGSAGYAQGAGPQPFRRAGIRRTLGMRRGLHGRGGRTGQGRSGGIGRQGVGAGSGLRTDTLNAIIERVAPD